MNVYQKEYKPEFIKELPVNFNNYKNMDLTYIPEEYHGLFTTDWNWGRYSTMSMDKRIMYQKLYLEYSHNVVRAKIASKTSIHEAIREEIRDDKPKDEEIPQGGFEGLKMN